MSADQIDDRIREALDGAHTYRPQPGAGKAKTKANGEAKAEMIPLTPAQWLARALPDTDHLLGELLSTTCRFIFCADTGLGKTMFAMAIAFAMHLGRGFLHWATQRAARVLFIDGEMPRDLMQERIALACQWFAIEPPSEGLFFMSSEDVEDMPPIDTPEGQAWLDEFIIKLGGVDFIIFDNFMCLCATDLRDEEGWRQLKPYVLNLTKRRIGQLWLHHVGHDKSRLYGTKTREWIMDTVALGETVDVPNADVAFKLSFKKARRRKPSNRGDFETVTVTLCDGAWSSGLPPAGDGNGKGLSSRAQSCLDALQRAIDQAGEQPPGHAATRHVLRAVKVTLWRSYFEQITAYEKGSGASRQAWSVGQQELLKPGGPAAKWGDWVWLR